MIKINDIVTAKRSGAKGVVVNIRRKGCKALFEIDFGKITGFRTRDEIEKT